MTDRHDIRPASNSEKGAALALTTLAFESVRHVYRPIPESESNRSRHQEAGVTLVALTNGVITATVRYIIDDDRLHIIGLAVHPDFRQQGLCRALIHTLHEIGIRHHLRALSLSTIKETGNPIIFEKLGFELLLEYEAEDLCSVQGITLHEVYMEHAL